MPPKPSYLRHPGQGHGTGPGDVLLRGPLLLRGQWGCTAWRGDLGTWPWPGCWAGLGGGKGGPGGGGGVRLGRGGGGAPPGARIATSCLRCCRPTQDLHLARRGRWGQGREGCQGCFEVVMAASYPWGPLALPYMHLYLLPTHSANLYTSESRTLGMSCCRGGIPGGGPSSCHRLRG